MMTMNVIDEVARHVVKAPEVRMKSCSLGVAGTASIDDLDGSQQARRIEGAPQLIEHKLIDGAIISSCGAQLSHGDIDASSSCRLTQFSGAR